MDAQVETILKRLFLRQPSSHKYDFGHVLVVGGAPGRVGAPLLAARAALRVGAGLVTIAARQNVVNKLEKRVEEVMTLRLPADTSAALKTLANFIAAHKVNALAIGPGLDHGMAPLVKELLQTLQLPVVLDAGGLSIYNGELGALRAIGRRNPAIILTPHQGEFARLTGKALPEDTILIREMVAETARTTGTTVILKGHHSLVASAEDELYVNNTGNPGLATAGTGDVLTGVIAGLAAQGLPAFEAATAGVYLHGLAGDLAATAKTEPGMIASDVVECIPAALTQIRMKNFNN